LKTFCKSPDAKDAMQLSNEGLTTRRDNDRTTLKAGERSGSRRDSQKTSENGT